MQSDLLPISHSMPAMASMTANCRGENRVVVSRSSSMDDDVGKPLLLPRSLTSVPSQQRRRRSASDISLTTLPSRQRSLRRDVGHAAAETYLLTRLSFKLLRYLGVGYRWITKFLALGCYAMLLMPGFLQVGYYYFFSSQVRRSIVYGEQPRNRLDLYLPININEPKPVVAFVTGGAWIIGYKAWGALLGQELAEKGVIVACIDYRNFPQGTISDMVKDASQGISFVCNNISEYGGDPNRIYLVGQSAGAHIAACALLDQAIKECGEGESTSWSVSQIKTYFGISGGYNILNLVDHFHHRGLYRSIFLSIMEGEQSLERFSPEVMVQDPRFRHAVSLLPPIVLLHGTADYSIPSDASKAFANALQRVGVRAELILYEGKTHTDLFLQVIATEDLWSKFKRRKWRGVMLRIGGVESMREVLSYALKHHAIRVVHSPNAEDPLRGGKDELLEDIISFIRAGDAGVLAKAEDATPRRRLVPEFMLKLAHKVSPF